MTLIIEDGTIVAGAISYVTAAEARAWALARGITLSATDSVVEAQLVNACDLLQSLEPRFKGSRADDAQALAWPRQQVYLYGNTTAVATTYIPQQLKDAQCQLAYDASLTTLQPTGEGRQVVMKQVDVLVTQYSDTRASSVLPVFNKAMGILAPLFRTAGALSTLRV